MNRTVNKVTYKAFGLTISSDILFPELSLNKEAHHEINVEIKVANLLNIWRQFQGVPNKFITKGNIVMFQLPKIGIFLIRDGVEILVSPEEGANYDQIRLYLLGTCMGTILMQRKIYPLHGSAVVINGKGYAIIGESGAGKSTLASAFLKQGYRLLSDDVIAVSLDKNDKPMVTPSYPQQKLWQESLNEFGIDFNDFRPIYQRETKFVVPVQKLFFNEPVPLVGIIELQKSNQKELYIKEINGLNRLNILFHNTYRNFLIPRLGLMQWHFNLSSRIANNTEMFQIKRPSNRFTANELVSLILKSFK